MRAFFVTVGTLAVLVCMPAMVQADWFEYFDTYAVGSQIVGQGGWEEWGFNTGALITDLVSQSPDNSVEIVGATDIVHRYAGYTSNKWLYKSYLYIPSDMAGQTYFILLSTFNPPTYTWAVQFSFDSNDGLIHCDCGLSPGNVIFGAYPTDEWIEIRVYIDLDEDWTQIYVNGFLLDDPNLPDHPTLGGGYVWTGGVFGGETNPLDIGAVDLFANNASSVYYDDMTLAASSAWVDLRIGTSPYTVDYTVVAGRDVGLASDVFLILNTPVGYYSYDGMGTPLGWNSGPTTELATGALGNHYGNALNIGNLPWSGSYQGYLLIDDLMNGIPNRDNIVVVDIENFNVP
jgi:hypothetical protein